jgi:hypothetical protein
MGFLLRRKKLGFSAHRCFHLKLLVAIGRNDSLENPNPPAALLFIRF